MKLGIFIFMFGLFSGNSVRAEQEFTGRPIVSQEMTCEQAKTFYELNKRIYVVTRDGKILPIYGMTPVSKAVSLRCAGRSEMKRTYNVRTIDESRCGIAVYCR